MKDLPLITENYTYTRTTFTGKNGTWICIGSESNGKIENTIDTFKLVGSHPKQFFSIFRYQIKELFDKKMIW